MRLVLWGLEASPFWCNTICHVSFNKCSNVKRIVIVAKLEACPDGANASLASHGTLSG